MVLGHVFFGLIGGFIAAIITYFAGGTIGAIFVSYALGGSITLGLSLIIFAIRARVRTDRDAG